MQHRAKSQDRPPCMSNNYYLASQFDQEFHSKFLKWRDLYNFLPASLFLIYSITFDRCPCVPRSYKFSCQRKTGNLAQCQQSAAGLWNSVSVPLYIEMTSVSYTYTYNNQYFSICSNVALEKHVKFTDILCQRSALWKAQNNNVQQILLLEWNIMPGVSKISKEVDRGRPSPTFSLELKSHR